MDKEILVRTGRTVRVDQHQKQERRSCFYYLEGWVFLGSIGYSERSGIGSPSSYPTTIEHGTSSPRSTRASVS